VRAAPLLADRRSRCGAPFSGIPRGYNPRAVTTTPPIDAFHEALDAGQFFEAHEILESFWIAYHGDDRDFFKGLIQAAAALHHAEAGNLAGARAVAERARRYLLPYSSHYGGVDVDEMLERLARLR